MPAGFATMSDAQQTISDYYRETAEQLRQLARVSRLTDIRADSLELSARFERIAAYVDAAIRLGAPGFLLPDGRRALSSSHDRTLRLWDLKSGASPVNRPSTGSCPQCARHPAPPSPPLLS